MRKTFKDDTIQKSFEAKGYAVIDFLSADDVNSLEKMYYDNRVDEQKFIEVTLWNNNYELNKKISEVTGEIISSKLKNVLDDHIALYSGYVTKIPGRPNAAKLHQDPLLVDEDNFRSVNVWSPLCEVDENNGAFYVVEGTHNLFRGNRGYTYFKYEFDDIKDEVIARFGKMVDVHPGQGVIYDHSLLHYSFDNRTDKIRIANTCFMIPSEVQPRYFHHNRSGNTLDLYEIDSHFMLTYFSALSAGDLERPLISRSDYVPTNKVSIKEFEELLNNRVTI